MNDLDRALGDIHAIRRQVANTTEFGGYGPATLASTAVFAFLAAVIQQVWLPDASLHLAAYFTVWVSTALLSALLTAVQMRTRARRVHSALSDEMIRMAMEQFLPALAAGLLFTVVLLGSVPDAAWMLPGIWQIFFSLGIFSSCRFLPKPMRVAGAWYLLTGLTCIAVGDARAFSPWAMGIPFGIGELVIAAVLFFFTAEEHREG